MVGRALLLLACMGSCSGTNPSHPDGPTGSGSDLVGRENEKPGDPSWVITANGDGAVMGYGDAISLHAGESLHVAVSTDRARQVSWTIYRMGWYGGAGARQVGAGGPVAAGPRVACPRDPVTSRVECSWTPSFMVPVAADALSGVYLVKLHTDSGGETYVPFVVVDGRTAAIVLNVNVTSWQAYNDYGGESLYTDASGTMPHGKAWEVSYDRPFANDHGAGRYLDWEQYFVRFVEALGYDVTYTTAFDLAAHPESISGRAFVSVANDEYWIPAERDAVQAARDRGVNLGFFGADQVLWRIRVQPSSDGRPGRVIAGYKDDQDKDPILAAQGLTASTARFRDPPNAAPENAMIGVMYEGWLLLPQPIIVEKADHWVFAGTGLAAGDALPGMTSAEFDRRYDNGLEPAGLVELGHSALVSAQGVPDMASMTYYDAPSGAGVFAAGTIGWPNGLGQTPYANPSVARITRNVLDRFAGAAGGADPDGAPWTQAGSSARLDGQWATVSTVAADLGTPGGVVTAPDGTIFYSDVDGQVIRRVGSDGQASVYAGSGTDGLVDGPGATARFRWPVGLALAPDGTLYVADSTNHVIRAIAPDADHTVSTVAGVHLPGGGLVDGPGAQARFKQPVGVALASDGSLLVADMQNARIRRIAFDEAHTVTTIAGSGGKFSDGPGASAGLSSPSGIAVAPDGTAYFIDTYLHALRRIGPDDAHTVTTLLGGSDAGAPVDGPMGEAHIAAQGGLVVMGGKVFFADTANLRVRALDLASSAVATVAGGGRSDLADGDGAVAGFATPLGIAAAPDGTLIVADAGNGALRRLRF